ncbi:MAG: hypothetical protein CL946_09710 [Ectothiorhodospiraceae bacterium]|nr:hypothetical protein [Ectothiorhodospiraceae bacterium]
MEIEIKKKRPISFGIKVGVAVVIVSVILGGLLRIKGNDASKSEVLTDKATNLQLAADVLVPILRLPVEPTSPEAKWTEALSARIEGETEVQVDRGRVDVMTDNYAIEIDFLKKWHEGLGQAIHYGDESPHIGVLALIVGNPLESDPDAISLIKKIDRLCIKNGVKLVLLQAANGSS